MKLLKFEALGWCPACKQLSKTLEGADLPVTVESIDIDADPLKTAEYGVRGVPTLILLDDQGTILGRKTGAMSKEALLEFVGQTS